MLRFDSNIYLFNVHALRIVFVARAFDLTRRVRFHTYYFVFLIILFAAVAFFYPHSGRSREYYRSYVTRRRPFSAFSGGRSRGQIYNAPTARRCRAPAHNRFARRRLRNLPDSCRFRFHQYFLFFFSSISSLPVHRRRRRRRPKAPRHEYKKLYIL